MGLMVSNLIFKSGNYYCSNCMVLQSQLLPRCSFCGYLFSNYEEIIMKNTTMSLHDKYLEETAKRTESFKDEWERKTNESNLYR